MNDGAATEIGREIEACIAAVEADVSIGTGVRVDEAIVDRLETLAARASALEPSSADVSSSSSSSSSSSGPASLSNDAAPDAFVFSAERPRRAPLGDEDADAFLRALSASAHARFASLESVRLAELRAAAPGGARSVASCARVAAGILRGRLAGRDIAIEPQIPPSTSAIEQLFVGVETPSVLRQHPSYRARGLLCAALAELRAAGGATFGRSTTPPADADRAGTAQPARPVDGPYRRKPIADPTGTSDVELELEIGRRVEAAGLAGLRRALFAHAEMIHAIARMKNDTRGLLGALAFWTKPAIEELEARARWHRALSLSTLEAAVVVVARARKDIFVFAFRQALIRVELTLAAMRPDPDRATVQVSSAGGVVHRREARRAIDRLRAILVRAWGDPGDRAALASEVLEQLDTWRPAPSPIAGDRVRRRLERPELVALLAAELRPTSFAAEHRARKQVAGARERRNELFEHALWRYPPAALVYRLDAVAWRVAAVTCVAVEGAFGNPAGSVRLEGKDAALDAFAQWATAARTVFGWMPSDAELLARHWGRMLGPPP